MLLSFRCRIVCQNWTSDQKQWIRKFIACMKKKIVCTRNSWKTAFDNRLKIPTAELLHRIPHLFITLFQTFCPEQLWTGCWFFFWKRKESALGFHSSLEFGCKLNTFMVKKFKKKCVDSCIYACACIITNYINHMAGKAGSLMRCWVPSVFTGINESRKYLAVCRIRAEFV